LGNVGRFQVGLPGVSARGRAIFQARRKCCGCLLWSAVQPTQEAGACWLGARVC
jgi:hypothetical protein